MCNNVRIKAFALAEILIALVIIGIVSALTIPTLVKKISTRCVEYFCRYILSKIIGSIKSMGLKVHNHFYVWTGEEASAKSASYRHFNPRGSGKYSSDRNKDNRQGICIE